MEAPPPILIAGHPALDFLNTVASPRGTPVELLPDGAALLRWLEQVGLVARADVHALRRRFPASSLDAATRRAVALRSWLRPIVARSAAHGRATLSSAELRSLNEALARGARVREVGREDGGYVARVAIAWTSASSLLVPIADAVADLVAEVDFTLVRPCAGAGCTLWFLDRTKGHRRQWCSMEVCGNRAKVNAHRARASATRTSK